MRAETPEQAIELFSRCLNTGDLDGALSLYEPGAAFVPQPGVALTGLDAIREALAGFFALEPAITGRIAKVIRAGDTALVTNAWKLTGTQPDGQAPWRASRATSCGSSRTAAGSSSSTIPGAPLRADEIRRRPAAFELRRGARDRARRHAPPGLRLRRPGSPLWRRLRAGEHSGRAGKARALRHAQARPRPFQERTGQGSVTYWPRNCRAEGVSSR